MGTDQHQHAKSQPLENAGGPPAGVSGTVRPTNGATMNPLFQLARLLGRQAAREAIASNRTSMTPEILP
jgi:hypothetical protein